MLIFVGMDQHVKKLSQKYHKVQSKDLFLFLKHINDPQNNTSLEVLNFADDTVGHLCKILLFFCFKCPKFNNSNKSL